MRVDAIDTLANQRTAFLAPAEEQERVYDELVMEPLRPMWEPMTLRFAPPGMAPDPKAPGAGFNFAKTFGFYLPEHGVEAGLQALDTIAAAGAWEASVRAISEAEAALRPAEHGVDLPVVLFTAALANPNLPFFMEGSSGYTGFGSTPGQVLLEFWPTDFNMPRLPAAAAHEFNHNVRLSFEPWTPDTSVGQYIVLEGLAEAFAGELYGTDKVGPWATALSEEQVAEVRPRMAAALEITGFDKIRGYIFGDWAASQAGYEAQGLPSYAGYTIGYRLVRAFMERTGTTAAEATYIPWRQIVAESAYF